MIGKMIKTSWQVSRKVVGVMLIGAAFEAGYRNTKADVRVRQVLRDAQLMQFVGAQITAIRKRVGGRGADGQKP